MTSKVLRFALALVVTSATTAAASDLASQGATPPEIASFLGTDRFGSPHPQAPAEMSAFGRLVGLWSAEVEVRKQDGAWARDGSALWAWQYVLDGFATQDLWLHPVDGLPSYLKALGRPYMLTALRTYEPASGRWRVAWAANGAGKSGGLDFGTLDGVVDGGDVVLTSESEWGHQRITFSEVTERSFLWTSEFSRDGESWSVMMRVRAKRLE